jgi:hypothetical protein
VSKKKRRGGGGERHGAAHRTFPIEEDGPAFFWSSFPNAKKKFELVPGHGAGIETKKQKKLPTKIE